MEVITGIQEFAIHLRPAYSRDKFTDSLRLALAVVSGRVPYITRDEIVLLGMHEDPFDGYVEVNEKIRTMAENHIYDSITTK